MNPKLIALVASMITINLFAQQNAVNPEIGKPVPAFVLSDLGNYKKQKMSSDDFKGRHVIIDFWNKNCISCVQSFPKLNQVHNLYKDKGLDLILVGTEEEGIQPMFENFRKKQDLKFPYAYNMQLYENSVPSGAPHLLWIDDKGMVKAITPGSDLTVKNIEAFLKGQNFSFTDHSHSAVAKQALTTYDLATPFMIQGNGASEQYDKKFRYRSLITEYVPGTPRTDWLLPGASFFRKNVPVAKIGYPDGDRSIFEVTASLKEIYRVAYIGYYFWYYQDDSVYTRVYPEMDIQVKDASLFECDPKNDTGFYWYSLVMPKEKSDALYVMKSMQNDLNRYFGYEARMEDRKFPYLKLVATDKAKKLITKGAKTDTFSDHSGFKATNIPLDNFLKVALHSMAYWETGGEVPIIINETGITENVDIDVKFLRSDWKDVQRMLKELGFELVPAEKEFKVLVIRDPK